MGNEKYFDENIVYYDKYRPTYGKEIYNDIITYAGINKKSRILEIGCGPGNATLPFLKTGADLTAVEIGENLATFVKNKFANEKNFHIVNVPFEEFITDKKYDLIFSATAFHWINSDYAYRHCLSMLEKGGALAIFWNTPVISDKNSELKKRIADLYNIHLPDGSWERLTEDWYQKRCYDRNKSFELYGYSDIQLKLYYDYRTFTTVEYIKLLHTYSNHMAMPEDKRKEFFSKIFDAISDYGLIEIKDTIDLYMGRK